MPIIVLTKILLPYDRGREDFLRELDRINARDMAWNSCQSASDLIY